MKEHAPYINKSIYMILHILIVIEVIIMLKTTPLREMEKKLEEYEKRGMRKSPNGPWKFRRGFQDTFKTIKI